MAYGTGLNSPQGFMPVRNLGSSTWNEQTNEYDILSAYATGLYTGQLVAQNSVGAGIMALPTYAITPTQVLGVFWGCFYKDLTGKTVYSDYWPAATAVFGGGTATAKIIDDPNVIFSVSVANSVGLPPANRSALAITDISDNADFVVGVGNTVTGRAASYLDIHTIAHTVGFNLKIYGLDPRIDNAYGINYNNALVLLNNHVYKSVGTLGV